ncbi:efflux RND transporter permease subunit [sulfur-oxidizing endosymbiont of Gigantopelta aegis]|uniref:efflux RND transporter permease subunit n=1 Tax=sulfur-oxidizing endosymbiont of Gigantopelta aegis TaxID=2794934 RepID=UPI0018DD906D|nr:efflux RND transporter permease subunit [sulfur-oxidizing endosymbiont of Gigantopelta aegis]
MLKHAANNNIAAWAIKHPIGVNMIALAFLVLGLFMLERLGVNLLPDIIYPDVRVRIVDPGVPATIMEDKITRQLEEQLAITEGAISIQSRTTESRSSVDLSFPYGTDINVALRDASNRLDRAKRFLPDSIDPPVIYKRDPSQIPIIEFIVSSNQRSPIDLRSYVDYQLSKWFINIPGVASTELGGGLVREIQIILDQQRLVPQQLNFSDIDKLIKEENRDIAAGRIYTAFDELSTRTNARFETLEELAQLPLLNEQAQQVDEAVKLNEVAQILDTHEDERVSIRLNGMEGVKLSIQKQPQANTVAVVDAINQRIKQLKDEHLIPDDVQITAVDDQAIFIKHALSNASRAALTGAFLAMLVVYFFLGDIRRTLIIGTAIPLAIVITFIIMEITGLTLNIMTLGGLALGIGMLVDSTIVMLENISRHQSEQHGTQEKGLHPALQAANEVNSAIVASTSTNLAAVLPFLFMSGLVGLLFKELIITISAAIVASMLVSLTVVPSLAAQLKQPVKKPPRKIFTTIASGYERLVGFIIHHGWLPFIILLPALFLSVQFIINEKQIFLPKIDEGRVYLSISGEPGMRLNEMDQVVDKIESLLLADKEVITVFSTIGGSVFGRSQRESSNSSSIKIQLTSSSERTMDAQAWITAIKPKIAALNLTGIKTRLFVRGVRGVRLGKSDKKISLRVQGENLQTLNQIGNQLVAKLSEVDGLRNLEQTYEENNKELKLKIRRQRAADLGIKASDIGYALRVALDGVIVSDFIENDREYNIRIRLSRASILSNDDLNHILIKHHNGEAVYLNEVANLEFAASPSVIVRDNQQRIVELTASLIDDDDLLPVMAKIEQKIKDFPLPDGYFLYNSSGSKAIQEGRDMSMILFVLAIFLVFVVMTVQYESLKNPLIILMAIPFMIIGVAAGLYFRDLPVSMPVWLGLIMLAGIVVNNAIVLVEQIELERKAGLALEQAISHAARLRLRPILMTTLTTVVGMLPLSIGLGDGAEMLQPLAVVIVWGLSFSMLVSLIIIPILYRLFHSNKAL